MQRVQLTKNGQGTRFILGIPFVLLTIFLALILSVNDGWVFVIVLVVGEYLYAVLHWVLYKKYMLNKMPQYKDQFYGGLVCYQLMAILIVVVVTYLLIPQQDASATPRRGGPLTLSPIENGNAY